MLDIITKEEYFSWLDQGYGTPKVNTLKGIQDAFILSQLAGLQNKRIAEIGGGYRVLTILSEKNDCWNVDKTEGVGQGPKNYKKIVDVKLVKAYMGEYSSDLPKEYFDIVFSISVVGHVNTANLPDFFKDMARILKPGGLCIHAIDAYLGDSEYKKENPQIDIYKTVCKENGIPLEFIDEPKIDATSVFSCWYASNSDMCIYNWNKSVPEIVNVRNNCQSVSIKAVWKKSDKPSTFDIIKKPDFHQLTNLPNKVESPEAARQIYEENKDLVAAKARHEIDDAVKEGKKIVLVYQMAKVGSTSYTAMLEKCSDLKVFQVHRLDNSSNEKMIKFSLSKGELDKAFMEQEWNAIGNYMLSKPLEIYIISVMRDPIARNISAFFENLDLSKKTPVEKLINNFFSDYPHNIPIRWFDEQFKEFLGIDLYQYPFDKKRGWDHFTVSNYTCLLLTVEISDKEKINAINSILGTRLSKIERKNVGESKHYATIYRQFNDKIIMPEEYVNTLLDSKVVKHFYTDTQCKNFRNKWIGKEKAMH